MTDYKPMQVRYNSHLKLERMISWHLIQTGEKINKINMLDIAVDKHYETFMKELDLKPSALKKLGL